MEKNARTEGQGMQMISFNVGEQEYGVDIHSVKEVIRQGEITPLPRAPSFLKGVINLRGDVIPIIDLRERFALEAGSYSEASRVIVVEIGEKSVGMVVDSVSHVIRVPEDHIEAAPTWLGGTSGEYVRGVARVEKRLVVLLNIDAILTTDEILEIAQSNAQPEPVLDRGL
jgi:purine-binding chemotaxis protein CheW